MADSEEVLNELDPPEDVDIIGIVVNEKGAERAINTNAVRTLGFPYSVSPTFLRNNQRQTLEEAIDELDKITNKGDQAGLETAVYISMAFGNPYGDPWNIDEVVDAVDLLESSGIKTISLADTIGIATPDLIQQYWQPFSQVRLSGDWGSSPQPSRAGRRKNLSGLRRGLPAI